MLTYKLLELELEVGRTKAADDCVKKHELTWFPLPLEKLQIARGSTTVDLQPIYNREDLQPTRGSTTDLQP